MSSLIKICGITSPEDARLAAESGAYFLGLIFVPETPRYLMIEAAREIQAVVSNAARWVGVFQNASLETIQAHISALSLDFIQLHGDESPEFCQACPKPVIKTLLLDAEDPQQVVQAYLPLDDYNIAYLLVDLPKGSSKTLDEALTPEWQEALKPVHGNLILAGKLTADSVGGIIESFHPLGVDVASGVEAAPGRKDPAKVRAFCQSVQSANNRIGVS